MVFLAVVVIAAGLLVAEAAGAAGPAPGRAVVAARPASAASSPEGAQARISPYAFIARQHALAASSVGHAPVVPPSMRRTRQPVGQPSPQ
jgi:hypothetical protein